MKVKHFKNDIPGYSGYIWAVKSTNMYGNTFGFISKKVRNN